MLCQPLPAMLSTDFVAALLSTSEDDTRACCHPASQSHAGGDGGPEVHGCEQAERGAFSAYAYEMLPLMHTLMSQSELGAEQFAADSFAFFEGYAGHTNADMRRWTAAVRAGAQGAEAAADGDAAHALVKVQLPGLPSVADPTPAQLATFDPT